VRSGPCNSLQEFEGPPVASGVLRGKAEEVFPATLATTMIHGIFKLAGASLSLYKRSRCHGGQSLTVMANRSVKQTPNHGELISTMLENHDFLDQGYIA
jgi:hypothetical protein